MIYNVALISVIRQSGSIARVCICACVYIYCFSCSLPLWTVTMLSSGPCVLPQDLAACPPYTRPLPLLIPATICPSPCPATTLLSTAESVSFSEINGICLSLSDFISMKISRSLPLAPNVEASVFKWLVCYIPFLFRSSCLTLVSVPKFPKRCQRGNLWLVPPTGWHPRWFPGCRMGQR